MVSTEDALRVREERARFLAGLGRALQPLANPDEIMATTARMLGEHLGVNRCAYAEVEGDEDHFHITGDYTRGDAVSIVGDWEMSAFGAETLRLMRENRPYVVDDVERDERISEQDRAGRLKIQPERVEVGTLLGEAADLTRPLAEEKGLELEVRTPEEPVEIETDPAKVRHILINLLSNAVKFTQEGKVACRVETEDGIVALRVRDTGIGIAPEERERIFDSFSQVEDAMTREVGGTGLGLAVARGLARLLGGDITVESTPGEGSTFTVEPPLQIGS